MSWCWCQGGTCCSPASVQWHRLRGRRSLGRRACSLDRPRRECTLWHAARGGGVVKSIASAAECQRADVRSHYSHTLHKPASRNVPQLLHTPNPFYSLVCANDSRQSVGPLGPRTGTPRPAPRPCHSGTWGRTHTHPRSTHPRTALAGRRVPHLSIAAVRPEAVAIDLSVAPRLGAFSQDEATASAHHAEAVLVAGPEVAEVVLRKKAGQAGLQQGVGSGRKEGLWAK